MNLTATLTFSLTCLLVCNSSLAAEKVYKWTDAKGQTHYSQHPPLNTETEVIKTQTGHSDPVDYQTPAAATKSSIKGADKTKDKDRCEAARKNADTLKTYARIRIKGNDGEFRYLTPDEQQQKIDETNKAIAESCD